MSMIESCIFYEDSKCLLKGGCCDLDCNLPKNGSNPHFYDEIDSLTEWQNEKKKKKEDFDQGLR